MNTSDFIQKLITETNNQFKTDFILVGSWAEKGYSSNDIDLTTDLKDDIVIEAAQHIALKTGMVVDVFPSWALKGLYRNYTVQPDGRHGWNHDLCMNDLIEAGIIKLVVEEASE